MIGRCGKKLRKTLAAPVMSIEGSNKHSSESGNKTVSVNPEDCETKRTIFAGPATRIVLP